MTVAREPERHRDVGERLAPVFDQLDPGPQPQLLAVAMHREPPEPADRPAQGKEREIHSARDRGQREALLEEPAEERLGRMDGLSLAFRNRTGDASRGAFLLLDVANHALEQGHDEAFDAGPLETVAAA